MRKLVLLPALALAQVANAQDVDILANAPPTSIIVETDYSGNDGLADCDWYRPAESLLADSDGVGTGCQIQVKIRGTLNREGAVLFYSLVEKLEALEHRVAAIVLDSRGGDAGSRDLDWAG